jgi:hypothetical protein
MSGIRHKQRLNTPFIRSLVIPAKAGIQGCQSTLIALDPGFRRGDGQKMRLPQFDGLAAMTSTGSAR